MSDVTTTVDTYLAMWNEQDASRRGELIEQAWTKDGAYLDPALEAKGHAALSEMVAQVHERFPGYSFTRTSGIDEHHGLVRFAWQLGDGNGTVAVAGLDVGELADDGKLRRITGFFGELPAD
jgi:SnoaL-like domain